MCTPKIYSEKEFYNKFQLVKNHFNNSTSFNGCLFETYGAEHEYVMSLINENKVITIFECENHLYFCSGYKFINRIGYLITNDAILEHFEVRLSRK